MISNIGINDDKGINMKSVENLVRPNIRAMVPYSTARDEFKGLAELFLDANESPYENGFNRYPDPAQRAVKQQLSAIKGVPAESIFMGNGSDEAIDLAFRIFCNPGVDNAIAIAPSYGMYSTCAAVNDVEMREVLLNEDFSLPVERILAAADSRSKLLFICSPNNPTGNAFGKEEIEALLSGFNGMVVLDEAYADFSDEGSFAASLGKWPNLIILQTLSKAWGMAGLRAGLAFASPYVIRLFSQVKYPYNINVATLSAVSKLLKAGVAEKVAETKRERALLVSRLGEMRCVERIYPSQANFLLVKVDDASRLYNYLLKEGIIVRDRSKMPLCSGCLRITVGTPAENRRLVEVVGAYDDAFYGVSHTMPAEEHSRYARVVRSTNETTVSVCVDLDRSGNIGTAVSTGTSKCKGAAGTSATSAALGSTGAVISSGLNFLDHMLAQIVHHGGIYLTLFAEGDLEVDAHHTMEDVAITLGQAISNALGDKRGIERYGFALPMDESSALVLLDFGGRIDFEWDVKFAGERVGDVPTEMFRHFFQSLASAMNCNLHIAAKGENDHHIAEAIFKAFARALKAAVRKEEFNYNIPSSKGVL